MGLVKCGEQLQTEELNIQEISSFTIVPEMDQTHIEMTICY